MASKSGAKGRKIGRNKKWCEVYRGTGRASANKALRMMRHLRRQDDWPTADRLAAMPADILNRAGRIYNQARAA